MRQIVIFCLISLAWLGGDVQMALGQGYPGGGGMPGGRPGMGGQGGMGQPGEEMPSTPAEVKPDAAAKKAFNAGVKSLNKAQEF